MNYRLTPLGKFLKKYGISVFLVISAAIVLLSLLTEEKSATRDFRKNLKAAPNTSTPTVWPEDSLTVRGSFGTYNPKSKLLCYGENKVQDIKNYSVAKGLYQTKTGKTNLYNIASIPNLFETSLPAKYHPFFYGASFWPNKVTFVWQDSKKDFRSISLKGYLNTENLEEVLGAEIQKIPGSNRRSCLIFGKIPRILLETSTLPQKYVKTDIPKEYGVPVDTFSRQVIASLNAIFHNTSGGDIIINTEYK